MVKSRCTEMVILSIVLCLAGIGVTMYTAKDPTTVIVVPPAPTPMPGSTMLSMLVDQITDARREYQSAAAADHNLKCEFANKAIVGHTRLARALRSVGEDLEAAEVDKLNAGWMRILADHIVHVPWGAKKHRRLLLSDSSRLAHGVEIRRVTNDEANAVETAFALASTLSSQGFNQENRKMLADVHTTLTLRMVRSLDLDWERSVVAGALLSIIVARQQLDDSFLDDSTMMAEGRELLSLLIPFTTHHQDSRKGLEEMFRRRKAY